MTPYKKEELLLTADNINLEINGRKILRNVSFEVRDIIRPDVLQGQVVSLLGRSGIGKTQLFKILSGLKKPTSGSVLINKEQNEVKAGDMGVVPQNYFLFEWRKVWKILEMAAAKNPFLKPEERKAAIESYVVEFKLVQHMDKYPMQLSGGQRQRVSIIQQLLNGSNFLLLDEPFSGLDIVSVKKVLEVLRKVSLSDEVKTLIIVSHDLASSLALSDTALILAEEPGKEGATITHTVDLIEKDLCWRDNIKCEKAFQDLVLEIEELI
ncbi:ATP-binding cassette domain-containing protein [Chitinophagaceae bacterium MMS25-I14]